MSPRCVGALWADKRSRLLGAENLRLLTEMIRVNLKTGGAASFLGMAGSLIGPAALLAVTYFVFKMRFGVRIEAYPLYLLIGICCVSFFNTASGRLLRIIVSNKSLFCHSTAPRENTILAGVFVLGYRFLLQMVLCVLIASALGLLSFPRFFLAAPLAAAFMLFILGFGILLAVAYVFLRDLEYVWSVIAKMFFFGTPIFFRLDGLPPHVRNAIYFGNPLTPFVTAFRQILMGPEFSPWVFGHALLLGAAAFAAGYTLFTVFENAAVEVA